MTSRPRCLSSKRSGVVLGAAPAGIVSATPSRTGMSVSFLMRLRAARARDRIALRRQSEQGGASRSRPAPPARLRLLLLPQAEAGVVGPRVVRVERCAVDDRAVVHVELD